MSRAGEKRREISISADEQRCAVQPGVVRRFAEHASGLSGHDPHDDGAMRTADSRLRYGIGHVVSPFLVAAREGDGNAPW